MAQNKVIKQLKIVYPKEVYNEENESWVHLATNFPNLVPYSELTNLDNEIRLLQSTVEFKN